MLKPLAEEWYLKEKLEEQLVENEFFSNACTNCNNATNS